MKSPLMGRVIRFQGGRHREVADLLPWALTGTLDTEEQAQVDAHLSVCADCRAEAEFQRLLRAEIVDAPLDVERSWAQMRRRLDQDEARSSRAPWRAWVPSPAAAGAVAIRTAPAWGGWALSAAMLASILIWWQVSGLGAYHALSARAAPPAAGDVLVVFRPDTPERELRAALRASGARIVGGPTEADAYILSAPLPARAEALAALRKRADVVMAEPIDPEPR